MQQELASPASTYSKRPPTPPEDLDNDIEEVLTFLRNDIDLSKTTVPQLQQIPSDTPPSSSPLRSIEPEHVAKKVEFLVTPTYHSNENQHSSPKSSPARSKLLRPVKSILKLGNVSPLPTPEDNEQQQSYFSSGSPQNFDKMLDSAVRQLESQSAYTRLDAYLSVNNALMAYDDMPRHHEMLQHLDSFQRFILRDIASREMDENSDNNIAVQALKLAARFLSDDEYRQSTSHDFQTSLLDRCMAILEREARSKAVFKMVLGLMAQQNASPVVLTATKIERLITLLQDVETRYQGNSVVAARLMIYRRLLTQAPTTMSTRIRDWLQHVLHGMISEVHDTRLRAIDACNHVALAYGSISTATKILHELLETPIDDTLQGTGPSKTYFEHFSIGITELLKDESTRVLVPRIWSCIVLFHRGRTSIHKWRRFKSWLLLLQGLLLDPDSQVRRGAHLAWRKFIYVVQPDANTAPVLVSLLMKPMTTGFARNGTDKKARELRQLALDGYYNLLHYALRPGTSAASVTFAWTHFVSKTCNTMIEASSKGRKVACRVLDGLLTAHTGTWNMQAALEETAIVPEELPRLPVRWTRDNLDLILPTVKAALLPALQSGKEDHVQCAAGLWSALVQCIVEAGAQEIRQSAQAKAAVKSTLEVLHQMLDETSNSEQASQELLRMQKMAFERLNVYAIHDESNTEDGVGSTLAKIIYYSNSRASSRPVAELLHSFGMLNDSSPQTVHKLCSLWQQINPEGRSSDVLHAIWSQIGSQVAVLLRNSQHTHNLAGNVHTLQQIIDAGRSILSSAPPPGANEIVQHAEAVQDLLAALFSLADNLPRAHGAFTAVIDTTSVDMTSAWNWSRAFAFVHSVVTIAPWPTPEVENEAPILRSYLAAFINIVNKMSEEWHNGEPGSLNVTSFLDKLVNFIRKAPSDLRMHLVNDLLPGILPWLEVDAAHSYTEAWVSAFFSSLFNILHSSENSKLNCNGPLEALLLVGFTHTSLPVVQHSATFWNAKADTSIVYSQSMQATLAALSKVLSIHLPPLEKLTSQAMVELPAFEKKVVDAEPQSIRQPGSSRRNTPRSDLAPVAQDLLASSSKSTRRKLFKSPRLRHDDSQLDFIPIASPPRLRAEESQHLTDNQREVLARQHIEAQAYPSISSSPMIMARASTNTDITHLDFELRSMNAVPTSSPHAEDITEIDFTSSPPRPQLCEVDNAEHSQSPQPVSRLENDHAGTAVHSNRRRSTRRQASTDNLSSSESDNTKVQHQLQTELVASFVGQQELAVDHDLISAEEPTEPRRSSRKHKRAASPDTSNQSRKKSKTRSQAKNGNETEDEIIVLGSQNAFAMVATPRRAERSQTSIKTETPASTSNSQQRSKKRRSKRDRDRSRNRSATSTPVIDQTADDDDDDELDVQIIEAPVKAIVQATRKDKTSPSKRVYQTAAGLVSRLREALGDCRDMVFGAQEEREIDDLLFELRQANHEAGRRGRETQ